MATPTDGRWITVKGTHIFIKDGQSVGDAISEHAVKNNSGFEKVKDRYGDTVLEKKGYTIEKYSEHLYVVKDPSQRVALQKEFKNEEEAKGYVNKQTSKQKSAEEIYNDYKHSNSKLLQKYKNFAPVKSSYSEIKTTSAEIAKGLKKNVEYVGSMYGDWKVSVPGTNIKSYLSGKKKPSSKEINENIAAKIVADYTSMTRRKSAENTYSHFWEH